MSTRLFIPITGGVVTAESPNNAIGDTFPSWRDFPLPTSVYVPEPDKTGTATPPIVTDRPPDAGARPYIMAAVVIIVLNLFLGSH